MDNHEFPAGLTAAEAAARQVAEGYNELAVDQEHSLFNIVLEVVREPMFLLLLGAGAIYALLGDLHEALILLGFVCVIMGVTILQERRTEQALAALRDLSSPRALVIRDGKPLRIAGREVVRDDVLVLSEGDRVAADASILTAHELAANESLLTGESEAVAKRVPSVEADITSSACRVYAGTLLTGGQGLARVTAIGVATELGKIGKSLQSISSESSPLQREIAALTRQLAVIGIGLCVAVTALFVLSRGGWLNGLLAGITLAMGILPQEFPVIMIVFLAFGARRIATQRVLTRRLSAIETLGETTVLCVDKTGTLTQNRMAVAALVVGESWLDVAQMEGGNVVELPEIFHELLEYTVLASEIEPHDPMEQAFQRFAQTWLANTEHLHTDWALAREYELTPQMLAMSHLWRIPEHSHQAVATKGAPEAIADLCHLAEPERIRIAAQAAAMADRGLRVLGIAKAVHSGDDWPAIQHDFDFEFLGLTGLADPLRVEVPAAVEECRQAGIRVVMITGDHPRTASAIAASAGIDNSRILTGAEFQQLDGASLTEQIEHTCVFARVTPQQKLVIVEALKAGGEIVAMTGDGVNDAPALKAAHIGIAMGKRGTDVAREAASLVLLDDDFGAIVKAVSLGRRIYANLRQAMIYTLAVHVPIIGLSILPLLFGLPLVLAPIHIAFLELVIDPACSVVFEAEAADAGLMRRAPRRPGESLLSGGQIALSLAMGSVSTLVVMGLYGAALASGIDAAVARTLAFVALIAANSVLIFSSRSTLPGRVRRGGNRVAYRVLAVTLLALILVTGVPAFAQVFAFVPIGVWYWLGAFALGAGSFGLFEAVKWLGTKMRG
ncbi:MAG: cation-translocating P-type ATPase [Sulfuriferula sp.]|nr:cation-translocating P-type ATPase [Sulfuriferula sp.]